MVSYRTHQTWITIIHTQPQAKASSPVCVCHGRTFDPIKYNCNVWSKKIIICICRNWHKKMMRPPLMRQRSKLISFSSSSPGRPGGKKKMLSEPFLDRFIIVDSCYCTNVNSLQSLWLWLCPFSLILLLALPFAATPFLTLNLFLCFVFFWLCNRCRVTVN